MIKKSFLAIAILALGASGISASADNKSTAADQPAACAQTPCCNRAPECDKTSCDTTPCGKASRHHGKHKMRKHGDARLLTGIELTADQQQRLDQLKQERREACKKTQAKSKAERRQARDSFTNSVRRILTPEQQAVFDANLKKAAAHGEKCKLAGKKKRDGRKGMGFKRDASPATRNGKLAL